MVGALRIESISILAMTIKISDLFIVVRDIIPDKHKRKWLGLEEREEDGGEV